MQGTITEVSVRKISFTSDGKRLVGQLYLPEGMNCNDKRPAVIVTGAWTTVKEQMPSTYAKALAERGYIAMVFDFRGWGESEGQLRYLEDPKRKTEDIISAAAFLQTQPEVDPQRIAGVGICASAGYMAMAYTQSPQLASVALVAPWLHNPELATAVYGGEDSVKQLISASDAAQQKYEQSGELTVLVAASTTDEQSVMYQAPYYTETDRGLIDAYDNKFNVASWRPWLTYDAMASATQLPGKLLMVGSPAMALPQGAQLYAEKAGNKVSQVMIDGITQFDFYDQEAAVNASVDLLDHHFKAQFK